jgi:hypothetical protein
LPTSHRSSSRCTRSWSVLATATTARDVRAVPDGQPVDSAVRPHDTSGVVPQGGIIGPVPQLSKGCVSLTRARIGHSVGDGLG